MEKAHVKKCAVEKCQKHSSGWSRYCSRHASQMRKHGKIISDEPSYRDPNEIVVCGSEAKIILRDKFGFKVGEAIIDSSKVHLVSGFKWYLTSHGYCASKGKNLVSYLHRLVLGSNGVIDHISGDKLDNRMSNLRECSHSQNLANISAKSNSKTGVKGVHPYKGGKKFCAQITHNRRVYSLGVFESIADAKKAYDEMAKKLFGEFAHP